MTVQSSKSLLLLREILCPSASPLNIAIPCANANVSGPTDSGHVAQTESFSLSILLSGCFHVGAAVSASLLGNVPLCVCPIFKGCRFPLFIEKQQTRIARSIDQDGREWRPPWQTIYPVARIHLYSLESGLAVSGEARVPFVMDRKGKCSNVNFISIKLLRENYNGDCMLLLSNVLPQEDGTWQLLVKGSEFTHQLGVWLVLAGGQLEKGLRAADPGWPHSRVCWLACCQPGKGVTRLSLSSPTLGCVCLRGPCHV